MDDMDGWIDGWMKMWNFPFSSMLLLELVHQDKQWVAGILQSGEAAEDIIKECQSEEKQ